MSIYLTDRTAQAMRYAVESVGAFEVMGFGHTYLDGQDIVVDDILIPRHEVKAATVEMSTDVLANLVMQLAERDDSMLNWRLWWHSHVNMGTNPSGTDEFTLKELATELGWMAGLVTNKKQEYTGWIQVTNPISLRATLLVEVEPHEDKKLRRRIEGLVAAFVTKTTYQAPESNGNWQKPATVTPRTPSKSGKVLVPTGGTNQQVLLPPPHWNELTRDEQDAAIKTAYFGYEEYD